MSRRLLLLVDVVVANTLRELGVLGIVQRSTAYSCLQFSRIFKYSSRF